MADKNRPKTERLYTSREAAELLGVTPRTIQLWSDSGILDAKKTPGGHRRFTARALEVVESELFTSNKPDSSDSGKLRVLIAEDEPDIQKLYELTMTGWSLPLDLTIVKDGYEALIQFGMIQPHLVILDLNMPRMDGFHMLNVINETMDEKLVDVIVVSALSKSDIAAHGGLPEGIAVFSKPIPFMEIENMLVQKSKLLFA